MEQDPSPIESAERCGSNSVKKIVCGDHAHPERGYPACWKAHDERHCNHAPTQTPDDSSVCPWNESPGKIDDGEFEQDEPQTAREKEPGDLLNRLSPAGGEKGSGTGEKGKNRRAVVRDEACEEERKVGVCQ